MRRKLLWLVCVVMVQDLPSWAAEAESAQEVFVSPHGNSAAAGTREDPLDLSTALKQPSRIGPGSHVWLLPGTYGDGRSIFISRLTGTADHPIIVRQDSSGTATIDGGLVVNGAYAWYWGFEVTNSQSDRTGDRSNPTNGMPDGIDVNGPYTRFINMYVHDTREGFGVWAPAEGAEVYGCLIYNNGWQGPDRGHGHGIYTQNRGAQKHLAANIIFNQFGVGIHAYGSSKAFVQGYLVDHNIVFNNGALAMDGRTDNLLFAVGNALSGIHIENNYTYHTPSANSGTSRIGWSYNGPNDDVSMVGNYFIGGYIAAEVQQWTQVRAQDNTFYSASSASVLLQLNPSQSTSGYNWDKNRYFGAGEFLFAGQKHTWSSWKETTGIDRNSSFTSGKPSGTWTFVIPNTYEPGRGNIVVYNWDQKAAVRVDLGSVLKKGSHFEVHPADNYFGSPLLSGTFTGDPVVLPMSGWEPAQPNGRVPNPPKHTGPEFGAFVVLSK